MVRPAYLLTSLSLLTLLLLFESCRSQRPLLADSVSQVTSRVQQRTELEASLLRSLSSFLSVDVIDSLFLLASPVQPASGVLAPDSLSAAVSPALLPVAVRHSRVSACLVENDTAGSVLKTADSTGTSSLSRGGYSRVVPPSRTPSASLLFLLLVLNIVCLLYLNTSRK